jgi:uncharacterized damage-inducible protein DinB
MAFMDSFLPEFDREMGTTRRLLERVPLADADWKPHAKSRSIGELATHVAHIPFMATIAMTNDELDPSTRPKRPTYTDTQAMLSAFDQEVTTARAALLGKTDAELMARFTMRVGSRELFSMPKMIVLRQLCLSHIIHHRGQLSVYLRLRDVPLPSIYGPSADEAI